MSRAGGADIDPVSECFQAIVLFLTMRRCRLCNEIFTLYTELDHETKPKNIAAWTPVVISILNGLAQLQDEDVRYFWFTVSLFGNAHFRFMYSS